VEWSIQDIARAAGTTSRTLRHYGQLGLLAPSRTGSNGYRYYDQDALGGWCFSRVADPADVVAWDNDNDGFVVCLGGSR